MREILFRGRAITGEWLYGSLITYGERSFIYPVNGSQEDFHFYGYEVIPETVGQFTGITDKTGVNIFEGDIINFTRWIGNWQSCDGTHKQLTSKHTIVWDNGVSRFGLTESSSDTMKFREHPQYIYDVIGNIHNNPEF